MFQVGKDCWFGGGCDLTPAYFFEEDARSFHTFWQGVCEKHRPGSYNEYKAWCDRYFYLPARKEHRGLGGVFFDDLTEDEAGSAEQVSRKLHLHPTVLYLYELHQKNSDFGAFGKNRNGSTESCACRQQSCWHIVSSLVGREEILLCREFCVPLESFLLARAS